MNSNPLKQVAGVVTSVLLLSCGDASVSDALDSAKQAAIRCPKNGSLSVDTFRELLIVHPSAIGDARSSNATGGPWSFRFLVEQMTPAGMDPADFVEQWLLEWERRTEVNGFTFPTRPGIRFQVLGPWPKRADGKLDLSRSPFRLMAIVNRMDLRSASKPNGEGRFVFAVHGPPTFGGSQPLQFTVIFEYNLPSDNGQTAAVWAERWHKLGSVNFGKTFNTQLQALTDNFTRRGTTAAGVNGSSISQVRTNEIALDSPWELREFHLDPKSGLLAQGTTGNNPDPLARDMRFFNEETGEFNPNFGKMFEGPLVDWLTDPANRAAILAGTHSIPTEFLGSRGLSDGIFWTFPDSVPADEELRRAFGKETCNGCHNGEVQQIDGFYHISPNIPPGPTGQNNVSEFMKQEDLPRRVKSFQNLMCPPAGVATSADGTAAPPARNGKAH